MKQKIIKNLFISTFSLLIIPFTLTRCSGNFQIAAFFKGDASLKISPQTLSIPEGGTPGSVSISLASKPTDTVSVALKISDTSIAYISPQSLTFLPENYSNPQTITVYPLSDCLAAGNRSVTLSTITITSADENFQSSIHPALNVTLPVTVVDNASAIPELLIQSSNATLTTAENGLNDKFLVALSCSPKAPVTVNLSSSNTNEGVLDVSSVTLDSTNYNLGALVTVTGQPDCVSEPDISYSVNASTVSTDTAFNGISKSINAINQNVNLVPQMLLLTSSGQLNRGNLSYNNFQVMLSCAPPTGTMTISTTVSGLPNGYTLWSPPAPTHNHVFDANNWKIPVDIITQVTSDSDGAYSVTLASVDQPGTFSPLTINVADSGTKYIGFYVTGLLAGNHFDVINNSDNSSTHITADGHQQIILARNAAYNLTTSTVSGTGPNQKCFFTGGSTPSGTLTSNISVANITCGTYYSIGGSISGLDTGNSFTITETTTSTTKNITADGSYSFMLLDSTNYTLVISGFTRAGGGAMQTCTFGSSNNSGTVSAANVGNIDITCAKNPYNINVAVTNLDTINSKTVVLQNNGSGNLTINANSTATAYTLPDHSAYSVSILTQPTGQVCAFTDATQSGTIMSAAINLNLNCVTGFMVGGRFQALAPAPLDYRLYQGKVTTLVSSSLKYPTRLVHLSGLLYFGDGTNESGGNCASSNCMLYSASAGTGWVATSIVSNLPGSISGITTDGTSLYFTLTARKSVFKVPTAGGNSSWTAISTAISGETRDIATDGVDIFVGGYNGSGGGFIQKINLATGQMVSQVSVIYPVSSVEIVRYNGIDYIYYTQNHGIARIAKDLSGSSTLAMGDMANSGFIDGQDLASRFNTPDDLVYDGVKNIFVADKNDNRIRRINLKNGQVSTIAGNGNSGNSVTPGTGAGAIVPNPVSLATDGRNLYFTDYNNAGTVSKITDNGLVGYWPLNGNVNDYNSDNITAGTHNTNDGTLTGGSGAVMGRNDPTGAYSFNGSTQYISASDAGLPTGTSPATLCAWVRPAALPSATSWGIVNYGTAANGARRGLFVLNAPDQVVHNGYGNGNDHMVNYKLPINTWTHLCATATTLPSNQIESRIYVNGKEIGRQALTWSTALSGSFYIGRSAEAAGYFFNGAIADVRIYARALNEGEINELAQDALAANVGVSYSTGATGLLSHYTFDAVAGAPSLNDSGPLNNGLTAFSGPTTQTGKDGDSAGAYGFSAANSQYLTSTSTNGLPMGAVPKTLCAWANPSSYPSNSTVFIIAGYSGVTRADIGMSNAAGVQQVQFHTNDSVVYFNYQLPLNTWSHVCVSYTGTQATMYVNGVNLGTQAALTSSAFGWTGTFVGIQPNIAYAFDGKIDDVRIYNNALPPDQIRQLAVQVPAGLVARYDFNGDAKDMSGFGNDLTNNGATASTDRFASGSSAMNFSGTSYLAAANTQLPAGNNPRSVCAWANPVALSTTVFSRVVTYGDGYGLGMDASGGGRIFALDVAGDLIYSKPHGMNIWRHLCVTFDGTTEILYLDAYPVATVPRALTTSAGGINIGRHLTSYGDYFNGSISDVRVYNRALAQPEIQALVQQPNKRIFVTAKLYNGTLNMDGGITGAPTGLTGIAGADNKCNWGSETNKPNTSNYKALLVDSTNRNACTTANCVTDSITENIDWVLRPNVTYTRADGITPIFTADWNGVWNFTAAQWAHPIGTGSIWTGLIPDWTLNSNGCCSFWTTNSASFFGDIGDATMQTIKSISTNNSNPFGCDSFSHLYCVEQ